MLPRAIFLCSLLTGCIWAASRPIGIITASGHFTLDRSQVWGNATLFSGEKIETDTASSQATLRNGVTIQLASASIASVSDKRLTLWKGTGQVAAPESYEIEAGGLAIRSASGAGRVLVGWNPGGEIEVRALSGGARVTSAGTGVILASIPAGRRMNFAMQAAAGTITRTGCLLYKDGHFLMQDQNTQEVVELLGQNLAANLANRVTVTGTASSGRPTLNIATSVLNVTSVVAQQQGGCLSVAAALDAQTTVANVPGTPSAPPSPSAPKPPLPSASGGGMSTGAKVGIAAAVVGGGVGAALALSGKKSSTSQ